MLSVATWSINAIIIGLALRFAPQGSKVARIIRSALVLLTMVGVALVTGHSIDIVLGSAFFLVFLALERLAPRDTYEMSADQTVLNALYFAAQSAAYALAGFVLYDVVLKRWPATWGLQAHGVPQWLQAIAICLVLDLKQYFVHRYEHRLDFLWRFHKVHHSPTQMNVMAGWRTHLVENFLTQALTTYGIVYLLNPSLPALAIGYMLPNIVFSGYIGHMNADFPRRDRKLPWFAYVFATPASHAFHHRVDAPATGINLGEIFMIWDVIFGSFRSPSDEPSPDVYGIPDADFPATGFLAQQAFSFRGLAQASPSQPPPALADSIADPATAG